jgi:trimeric autotransporter adhesin
MKKITILLCLLAGYLMPVFGQCTNETKYPNSTITANNLGILQVIATNQYTQEYAEITGLTVGGDYIFTCTSNATGDDKYITVRTANGDLVTHGPSPLSVDNIAFSDIQIHYNEDADCLTDNTNHTTTLFAVLACPLPTDVQPTVITTTGATFNWVQGAGETAWQVLVLAEGADAPTATTAGTPVTATPGYTTTVPLTPGTDYQFYIRSDCGTEFSPWGGPYDFTTLCLPTAAFTQNFETTDSGDMPVCWTALLDGEELSEYATVSVSSGSGVAGGKGLALYNSGSAPESNIMAISPNLSNLSAGTQRIKFAARADGTASVEVGTMSATNDAATFTMLETLELTTTYAEYVVDFTGYSGTDTFVAFRHAGTNTYTTISLDDVRWEVAPACADVTGIEVHTITTQSAGLFWVANGGETGWDVVYGPTTVTDPTTLTPISPAPAGSPGTTINGLTPNTSYNVWVRSACGGTIGNGAWIGPVVFTTACLPIGTFSENFDTTDEGELPGCWSALVTGETVSQFAYVYANDNQSVSGDNSVEIYNSSSGPDDTVMLVSPNLNTLSAGTHRLKFYATSNNGTLQIGTLNGNTDTATFTMLEEISVGNAWEQYTVNFTGYTGTDTYIGIRNSSGIYTSVYVDDVLWEVAPACADVTDIEINTITTATANVNWVANSGETGWDVVYGPATVTDPSTLTPISPAPTGSPIAALSGLTPNTSYNVWVRSVCGGTAGNGAWIGPVTFTTACVPVGVFSENFDMTAEGELPGCWSAVVSGETVSQYAYVQVNDYESVSGENSVEIYNSNSGEDDNVILVSPNLNTLSAGTHRLKFNAYVYNGGTVQVGTLDGNNESAAFTMLEEVIVGEDWAEYVVNFDGYTGTDTYIGIRNSSGTYTSVYVDDVRWELAPLCADVTDITINQIGTATADADWMAGGNEGGWQIVYGPATVTDPSNLTPSPVLTVATSPLSGLADNTAYNVWVRSVCGGANGNGAWIGPISFRTLCLAGSLPYMQDFENAVSPALPECLVGSNEGEGNDWATENNPGYGFTNRVASYSYNSDYAADAWLYTRGLALTAGTSYTISYKYGDNGNDSYTEKMEVKYGLSPDVAGMTLPLADHPEINTNTALTNTVTFTPPATGTYYFGFHAYSDANQYDIYLDNIAIDAALGNPDMLQGTFTYYPNPVKDVLKMSYTNAITNVIVYNMLGQAVITTAVNQTEASIDMSRLPAGNYIVKVSADTMTKTIKVIKD